MTLSTSSGFLLLNKPKDTSSFDCVLHIRSILKAPIKIGHTGTLDNFATGLLIICIGRDATKLVDSVMNFDKQYQVKAKLGQLTDTLDYTGETTEEKEWKQVTKEDIIKAMESLGPSYEQVPPIFSALKFQGTSLYKLARQGNFENDALNKIVEAKKRTVTLHELKLLEFSPPFFTFHAHVSKGTYVRTLANDIALKAGTVATTYELERTYIGPFSVDDAIDLEAIEDAQTIAERLIPTQEIKDLTGYK